MHATPLPAPMLTYWVLTCQSGNLTRRKKWLNCNQCNYTCYQLDKWSKEQVVPIFTWPIKQTAPQLVKSKEEDTQLELKPTRKSFTDKFQTEKFARKHFNLASVSSLHFSCAAPTDQKKMPHRLTNSLQAIVRATPAIVRTIIIQDLVKTDRLSSKCRQTTNSSICSCCPLRSV